MVGMVPPASGAGGLTTLGFRRPVCRRGERRRLAAAPAAASLGATVMAVGGCAKRAAPTYVVVGAYFPAWMVCCLVGIAAAILLRLIFLATGIDTLLSFRLFTYGALGVLAGLTVWSTCYGP